MFKNTSALGAFGEFVYKRFCEMHGVSCVRTNYCHTDFLVTPVGKDKEIYVDVKTTQGNIGSYGGKRYHSEIAYESISVSKEAVLLVPDKLSPFNYSDVIEIGSFQIFHQEWLTNPKDTRSDASKVSKEVLSELRDIFSKTKYPKVRLVERGDASNKRWTGTVDNLPGTDSTIKKSDVTVFIQYRCFDFRQIISSITVFPHDFFQLELVPMLEPNQRQKNKGINQVVDLNLYAEKYPKMIFSSIDQLKVFAEKLI